MGWVFLALAILAEVAGTLLLRASDGFSRVWPSIGVVIGYGLAFTLLSFTLKHGVPIGVAYAVWAGAGTALIASIGFVFLGEAFGPTKAVSIGLIVIGVVGINISHTG